MHVSKRHHSYSISGWSSALLLKGGWWWAMHIQGQPSTKSSSDNSSTLAPWWPITTEGASKFRISMEAVKVDTHFLSFTVQPDGVGGLANLSTDPAVGATWFSNLAGLVAWAVSRSFLVLVLDSAEGTVVSSTGGVSIGLGWVSLVSAMAGEAMESPCPWSWLQIGTWAMERWCHLPTEFSWDWATCLQHQLW